MRILTIVSEAPPIQSGVARCVGAVTEGLRARGHHVDIISCVDVPRWSFGEFRFTGFAGRLPELARELEGYDIVNVHGPAPTLSDLMLLFLRARSSKRPAVVYTHHSDIDLQGWELASEAYNRLHRSIAAVADRIVVTSEAYRRKMQPSGAPVTFIPWGVDLDRFAAVRLPDPPTGEPGPLKALFVGQMRPYKGLGNLIEAAAGQPRLSLTVVGSGQLEDRYRDLASRLQADNVSFRGRVSDEELVRIYGDHDVVVLPSVGRGEAFGLVLLEGMASGCVPVASDLPGVREVAGPTGALVAPGDVGELRRTLLQLDGNRSRLRTLAASSRERVIQMEWSAIVDRYEELFEDSITKRGRDRKMGSLPVSWRDPDRVLRRLERRFGAKETALLLLAEDRSTVLGSWGTVGRLGAERVAPVARRSVVRMRADFADPSVLSSGARSTFGLDEEGTKLLTIPIKSRDLWLVVVLAIRHAPGSADGDARGAEPQLRPLATDTAPSAA